MPLIMQKRSSRVRPVLPITLSVTASLVISLCYLQVLYTVSHLARPFWGQRREFPPFKGRIERWEKMTIDIILGIVPSANYRSPTPTWAPYEDSPSQRFPTFNHTSRVNLHGINSSQSRNTVPPNMLQCYPTTAAERVEENQPTTHLCSPQATPVHQYSRNGFSIDHTMKEATGGSQTKTLAMLETRHCNCSPSQIAEDQDMEAVSKTTSNPNQNSPACSLDGPNDLDTAMQSLPLSDTEHSDDELKLSERTSKYRSTESYPGKFPVSDSAELSSLATAQYAFRERGTTSVRPFSDY